jgi:hypothetical protein
MKEPTRKKTSKTITTKTTTVTKRLSLKDKISDFLHILCTDKLKTFWESLLKRKDLTEEKKKQLHEKYKRILEVS